MENGGQGVRSWWERHLQVVEETSENLHVCMCMYFWAHTDNIVTVLSCMYEQKDTYTYRHHTDMSVSDTYMSVLHTDKSVCAYICLNVYVSDSPMDSIVFVLSLYDVCISGTEACIVSVSCQYYT